MNEIGPELKKKNNNVMHQLWPKPRQKVITIFFLIAKCLGWTRTKAVSLTFCLG